MCGQHVLRLVYNNTWALRTWRLSHNKDRTLKALEMIKISIQLIELVYKQCIFKAAETFRKPTEDCSHISWCQFERKANFHFPLKVK